MYVCICIYMFKRIHTMSQAERTTWHSEAIKSIETKIEVVQGLLKKSPGDYAEVAHEVDAEEVKNLKLYLEANAAYVTPLANEKAVGDAVGMSTTDGYHHVGS